MINFKFDDKKDIESKMFENYVNQENPEETIRDLARYNHHILSMKKEDNYDAILSYMIKNCNDFYEEKYFKITTFQHNDWIRITYVYQGGTVEEIYER